jgi:hypothetical protein
MHIVTSALLSVLRLLVLYSCNYNLFSNVDISQLLKYYRVIFVIAKSHNPHSNIEQYSVKFCYIKLF